jgi:hypothetical protein
METAYNVAKVILLYPVLLLLLVAFFPFAVIGTAFGVFKGMRLEVKDKSNIEIGTSSDRGSETKP